MILVFPKRGVLLIVADEVLPGYCVAKESRLLKK
jgi:hypothetical protein